MPISTSSVRAERGATGTPIHANPQPVPSRHEFHPFKIYRAGNLKYRVRGGYAGFRSNFGQFLGPGSYHVLGENGETVLQVLGGSDGVYEDATNIDYWSSSTKVGPFSTVEDLSIPNATDIGVSVEGDAATWTLNSDLDDSDQMAASFWVEITDDDAAPTAEIKGRMWSLNAGSTGRPANAFPDFWGYGTGIPNQTTIVLPIGVVRPLKFGIAVSQSNPLVIEQFAVDHIIRRFPAGVYNAAGSLGGTFGPNYWRGDWDDDNLSGSFFYDGDLVTFQETVTIGAFPVSYKLLYAHVGQGTETALNANFRLVAGPV